MISNHTVLQTRFNKIRSCGVVCDANEGGFEFHFFLHKNPKNMKHLIGI